MWELHKLSTLWSSATPFSVWWAFSCTHLPWSSPIFYIALNNVCIVMSNVCGVVHFCCMSKTSTWGRAVSCVYVHLPAIGVYAVWLDALLPLQFPYTTKKQIAISHLQSQCVFVCTCLMCVLRLHWMCICSISLTSVIASRSSSANFLSSSPLGEQKLTSCFFSEVNGLSMVMPWA